MFVLLKTLAGSKSGSIVSDKFVPNMQFCYDDRCVSYLMASFDGMQVAPGVTVSVMASGEPPTYVQGKAVDSFQNRLIDEFKVNQGKPRVLFVPYNPGGGHWTALVIQVNSVESVDVFWMDSMDGSLLFDPYLKSRLEVVYGEGVVKGQCPPHYLQPGVTECASVMVRNFENWLLPAGHEEALESSVRKDSTVIRQWRCEDATYFQDRDCIFLLHQERVSFQHYQSPGGVSSVDFSGGYLHSMSDDLTADEVVSLERLSGLLGALPMPLQELLMYPFMKLNRDDIEIVDAYRLIRYSFAALDHVMFGRPVSGEKDYSEDEDFQERLAMTMSVMAMCDVETFREVYFELQKCLFGEVVCNRDAEAKPLLDESDFVVSFEVMKRVSGAYLDRRNRGLIADIKSLSLVDSFMRLRREYQCQSKDNISEFVSCMLLSLSDVPERLSGFFTNSLEDAEMYRRLDEVCRALSADLQECVERTFGKLKGTLLADSSVCSAFVNVVGECRLEDPVDFSSLRAFMAGDNSLLDPLKVFCFGSCDVMVEEAPFVVSCEEMTLMKSMVDPLYEAQMLDHLAQLLVAEASSDVLQQCLMFSSRFFQTVMTAFPNLEHVLPDVWQFLQKVTSDSSDSQRAMLNNRAVGRLSDCIFSSYVVERDQKRGELLQQRLVALGSLVERYLAQDSDGATLPSNGVKRFRQDEVVESDVWEAVSNALMCVGSYAEDLEIQRQLLRILDSYSRVLLKHPYDNYLLVKGVASLTNRIMSLDYTNAHHELVATMRQRFVEFAEPLGLKIFFDQPAEEQFGPPLHLFLQADYLSVQLFHLSHAFQSYIGRFTQYFPFALESSYVVFGLCQHTSNGVTYHFVALSESPTDSDRQALTGMGRGFFGELADRGGFTCASLRHLERMGVGVPYVFNPGFELAEGLALGGSITCMTRQEFLEYMQTMRLSQLEVGGCYLLSSESTAPTALFSYAGLCQAMVAVELYPQRLAQVQERLLYYLSDFSRAVLQIGPDDIASSLGVSCFVDTCVRVVDSVTRLIGPPPTPELTDMLVSIQSEVSRIAGYAATCRDEMEPFSELSDDLSRLLFYVVRLYDLVFGWDGTESAGGRFDALLSIGWAAEVPLVFRQLAGLICGVHPQGIGMGVDESSDYPLWDVLLRALSLLEQSEVMGDLVGENESFQAFDRSLTSFCLLVYRTSDALRDDATAYSKHMMGIMFYLISFLQSRLDRYRLAFRESGRAMDYFQPGTALYFLAQAINFQSDYENGIQELGFESDGEDESIAPRVSVLTQEYFRRVTTWFVEARNVVSSLDCVRVLEVAEDLISSREVGQAIHISKLKLSLLLGRRPFVRDELLMNSYISLAHLYYTYAEHLLEDGKASNSFVCLQLSNARDAIDQGIDLCDDFATARQKSLFLARRHQYQSRLDELTTA